MKKRVLLSVAAATALTLGVSSLDAQAATVQPSNIKVQNIQHSKVMMKQMSQQELQAFLQSMGVESLAQWQQGNFQPNCIIPGQQPTENVVTEQPTAKPETQKPAEQKPAEQKPAEEVQKPEAQKPAENNNTQKPAEQKPAGQKPAEEAKSLSEFEQRVVELTNAERAKQGLPALKIDTELSKVARIKSEDMQKNNYFDHNSPTYGSPFDMMKKFGISYTSAGENIAQGQRTPEEVVQAWMNSAGHRANILNNGFTHIGVGYVESGNYWTQQFITK
ncbi:MULTISPECIES: CAP domain-containing protein [Bacillus cereus group]|uniref:CAP domain-containing protein n=1 Tax=Bacillus cereus group TaxID=86661 RepID=UPI0022E1358F|nr:MULTISPECIES: CAP domain-containing protein [unclassified Bacillus cereus group]MDA2662063.1 CAP domain-containing protein [Bacillus cereus group sp. Bc032]MDA2672812.1 CAP domain-containing protein [Bacillus cereus group sp. Bc031]MDA2678240.1 CAP domain-containing protein [Bacillus cereus group sp. Bc029]MDA2683749.1 CAP domain-containing protein [Bacillus cereus group sp. Bc030]MDA2739200.1 CAP domain-containing protein [Bacillus cereus group sp. Bc011]